MSGPVCAAITKGQQLSLATRWFSQADQERIKQFAENLPEYLYRYVAIGQKSKRRQFAELLRESKIYFSRFSGFNDPYDGKVTYEFKAAAGEVRAYWDDYARELEGEGKTVDHNQIEDLVAHSDDRARQLTMEGLVAEHLGGLGVCCLSARPDDIPMWSYYADSHQGVCLRFSRAGLVRFTTQGVLLVPVRYSTAYPIVDFYHSGLLDRVMASVATKSKAWEHEGEWRMVHVEQTGLEAFPPAALDAVILGCHVSPGDEAFVRLCVANRTTPTQLLRAEPQAGAYALRIVPAV